MAHKPLDLGRLPVVEGYEPPAEAGPGRLAWEVDANRVALLIHDMQRYFLGIFPADEPPLSTVVSNVRRIRARCDELGIPVFYTAQIPHHDPRDRGLQADLWGPGMSGAAEDSAIIDALAPAEGHEVLRKWRYSAFQRSPLHAMMLARGRDQMIVTGVYAQIGCLLTAADGFMRDIQPFMPVDAVADFSLSRHLAAVEYVGRTCGRTLTTTHLLERL